MAEEREREQELEWLEAQNISVSVDLVAGAKRQLQFLAAVDRNRWLYEGPALERAIYRYNTCWLPLLAKHSEISEGPLVAPLDCEWIWHCHRLNPVRYKSDCEKLFGSVLDSSHVVSSLQGTCKRQTEVIWNSLNSHEPYELDLTRALSEEKYGNFSELGNCTSYDLVSAVKRQSPFFYQVSRPHMSNHIFLEEAVARYKGFLHLIKRNRERSIKRFCVPTYDIDLIWHTHQLHAGAYSKDLREVLGKILEHDDMDADRTKGKKLDVGFSGTTRQWEETFGSRYRKAGAMYRGSSPTHVTTIPFSSDIMNKKAVASSDSQKIIRLPDLKVVEIFLEIVGVKNLPEGHKGSLYVLFSKSQPDVFFNAKRKLKILSESREKQVASFQCEPVGELLFELVSHSPSNLPIIRATKTLGTVSLSLQNFLNPVSKLAVEKWLELVPKSGNVSSKPIYLRVAVSFTVPTQAPHVLDMVSTKPQTRSSCFFPLPGRSHHFKEWTKVFDETDSVVISLQMRNLTKVEGRDNQIPVKQVIGLTNSGESRTLAESIGTSWSLLDSNWCLQPKKNSSEDGHLFELLGTRMMKLFQGRKLEFEPKHFEKQKNEQVFMTAVEFSEKDPYGTGVALLGLKSGLLKVKEEWLVLPGIISAFILSDTLKNEGFEGFIVNGVNLKLDNVLEGNVVPEEAKTTKPITCVETEVELNINEETRTVFMAGEDSENRNIVRSGGCGGCGGGGGCGNMAASSGCGGGCGSGCGGGCGNMAGSSGCGSGCGIMVEAASGCGGCGNMVEVSGGCGSGCGIMVDAASGCGSRCGSGCGGCGNMVEVSGGCGSGCGIMVDAASVCGSGGRGNMVEVSGGCGDETPIYTKAGEAIHESIIELPCAKETPISASKAIFA